MNRLKKIFAPHESDFVLSRHAVFSPRETAGPLPLQHCKLLADPHQNPALLNKSLIHANQPFKRKKMSKSSENKPLEKHHPSKERPSATYSTPNRPAKEPKALLDATYIGLCPTHPRHKEPHATRNPRPHTAPMSRKRGWPPNERIPPSSLLPFLILKFNKLQRKKRLKQKCRVYTYAQKHIYLQMK